MQTLKVRKTDPKTGAETIQTVKIIRSWSDASGRHIFLHTGGVYGYRDGAPVKSLDEITSLITNPSQKERAEMWWNSTGSKLSAAYYAGKQALEKQLAGDFQPDSGAASAERDASQYCRKDTSTPEAEWSPAHSWMELFPTRPDWWGQCDTISFQDFTYCLAGKVSAQPPQPPPQQDPTGIDEAITAATAGLWERVCKFCPERKNKCKCTPGSAACQKKQKDLPEEF